MQGQPLGAASQGGSWINPGIEDTVFATLWYPDDVMAHLHVSWISPRKVRDITLVGEKGMLTFDDMNLQEPIRFYDKAVTEQRSPGFVDTFGSFRTNIREGDVLIPRVSTGEPLRIECEHFLDCIVQRARPLADGWSGTAAVRVLAALDRSRREGGRRVDV